MRSERQPFWKCRARCLHSGVDICGRTLGNGSQLFSVGRIDRLEVAPSARCLPCPVDEVSEAVTVALQPGSRLFRIFWSGTVLHRKKFFSDTHFGSIPLFLKQQHPAPTLWDDDTPPNSARSRDAPVAVRCLPITHSRQNETARRASTKARVLLSSWPTSRSIAWRCECRPRP